MEAAGVLPAHAPLLTASARLGLRSQVFRWAIAPSILAWMGLVAFTANGFEPALCLSAKAGEVGGLVRTLEASLANLDPAAIAIGWGLMLVAMMGPLTAPMLTYVAARGFADRRDRAVGLFILGYAGVWTAAAAAGFAFMLLIHALVPHSGPGIWLGLFGVAAAAAWQLSPAKRRALNRCHGVVALRADGWAADADAARFGAVHGGRCVRACGPTMFLTMIGAHGVAMMAVVFAVLLAERTSLRPRQTVAAFLLLLAGIVFAAPV